MSIISTYTAGRTPEGAPAIVRGEPVYLPSPTRQRAIPLRPVGPKKRAVQALSAAVLLHLAHLEECANACRGPEPECEPGRGARAAFLCGRYDAWRYVDHELDTAIYVGERGGYTGGTRGRRRVLVQLLEYARTRGAEPPFEPPDWFFEGESPIWRWTREEYRAKKAGERAGYAAVARVVTRLLGPDPEQA